MTFQPTFSSQLFPTHPFKWFISFLKSFGEIKSICNILKMQQVNLVHHLVEQKWSRNNLSKHWSGSASGRPKPNRAKINNTTQLTTTLNRAVSGARKKVKQFTHSELLPFYWPHNFHGNAFKKRLFSDIFEIHDTQNIHHQHIKPSEK